MTDEPRPYPEYKESGHSWLGKVPAHWDCLPHRAVFKEIKEQGHVDEPLLSVTISKGTIRQADLIADSSMKDSSNLDKSKYKLVEPGDIAYNKMRAWQGAVGVSRHRGIVSPAYVVVRLRRGNNPDYFHFLFRTPCFAKEAERWSYGITSDMWSLRPEHFRMIYSCVPPPPEQDTIAGFLRGLDTNVSRFILNRRRLVEVLNEQEQAIIDRAVTRGLDPNVPLKPSGIDWLGQIPNHWQGKRLRNIVELRVSNVDKHSRDGEAPVRLCNYTDVYKNSEIRADMPFMLATATRDEITAFRIRVGDVIITKDSEDWRDIGVPAVVVKTAEDLVCGYHLAILRPRTCLISGGFLAYALRCRSAVTQFSLAAQGVTRFGLSLGAVKDLSLALPPTDEQEKIVTFVNEATASLDKLIRRTHREIDLIREYRTRLVADVVTGKLDVRRLTPDIGEEPAEAVDLDEGTDYEDLLGDEEVTDAYDRDR